MTEGCAVAPLSRYFSAPAVEQEDAADLPQPHGTLKIWHSGQSIDDREKTLCPKWYESGAYHPTYNR